METTNSVVGTWVLVLTEFSPTSPYNYFSVLPYSRRPKEPHWRSATIQERPLERILSTGTWEEMKALQKLMTAAHGKD